MYAQDVMVGATVVMAVATIVVAFFAFRTWYVYDQMRKISEQAPERQWMPLIELKWGGSTLIAGTFTPENTGKGTALQMRASYRHPNQESPSSLPLSKILRPRQNSAAIRIARPPSTTELFDVKGAILEIYWEDVFGNRFRRIETKEGVRYSLYE